MSIRSRSVLAMAAAFSAVLLGAPATGGAATLGQVGPEMGGSSCGGGTTFLQDGSPSYLVPAGGGVITSWSTRANAGADEETSFKVLHKTNDTTYEVVASDGPRPLDPGVVNTFFVRLPVAGGETLGMWWPGAPEPNHLCYSTGAPVSEIMRFRGGNVWPDPAPTTTVLTDNAVTGARLNLAATFEPDADRDGFGDLTQDRCPTNRLVQGACPPLPPSRFGNGVTIIQGTAGNDRLVGTPGRDVVICGGGNDTVATGDGDDEIRCGGGNDRIDSGAGKDHVVGETGSDTIRGGSGNDRLGGGSGRDRLSGGAGADRLSGNSGRDSLKGNSGNDRLLGGSGKDRLSGGAGNDRLVGGPGLDKLVGGPGRDRTKQ